MRERLPHALLIHGQQGTGKRDLALHFAQGLLCDRLGPTASPAAWCAACLVQPGQPPDFTVVRRGAGDRLGGERADDSGKKKAPARSSHGAGALIEAVEVSTHGRGCAWW
ncbi:hypothetical protein ACTMU2_31355 [Cupriavidus basilensis]